MRFVVLRLARCTRNLLTGDGEMVRAMMSAMVVLLLALPVSAVWASPAYRVVSEDGDSAALRVTVRLDARQSEADLQGMRRALQSRT